MTKILLSLMTVALVAGMAGGGLFAAFSDTETSEGNTFTAGVLDLKVEGKDDPVGVLFNVDCMKPGDWRELTANVTNEGCVDGIADIHFLVTSCNENGIMEPEVGAPGEDGTAIGELCDNLEVGLAYDGVPVDLSAYDANSDGVVTMGELSGADIDLGPLGAYDTATITLTLSIPITVGNCIMSDDCVLDIDFTLHQPIR
jgi:predicted ribosomally synthesized peptide with SipW-like signal peptide